MDLLDGRAEEDQAGGVTGLDEAGVLGQETIARVHALGAALAGDGDQLVDVEIGLGGGTFAEAVGFIGLAYEGGFTVGFCVDGDALDTEGTQRALDSGGDGATVGNQDLVEHDGVILPAAGRPAFKL